MTPNKPRLDNYFWSETALAEVKQRWREGQSARAIATHFAVTRNAIMGLVHRHKMHRPPVHRPLSHPVTRLAVVPGFDDPPEKTEPEPPPLPKRVPDLGRPLYRPPRRPPVPGSTLLQLGPGACRWPLDGAGASLLFCGADTTGSTGPYCAEHHALAVSHGYSPLRIRLP